MSEPATSSFPRYVGASPMRNGMQRWTPPLLLAGALGVLYLSMISQGDEAPKGAKPLPATPVSSWPIYRGDRALVGVAPGALGSDFKLAWTYEIGKAVVSSPVIDKGRVYIGADDGNLHCIDFASGKRLWAFESEDIIEAAPLVLDDMVFVGSSDFYFYALHADSGKLAWKYETDDRIMGSANWIVKDGARQVMVGSYDGRLYCFDAETGKKLWQYQTENYVHGTPAILGDKVVFGGCDAALHVVSASSGKAIDRLEIGEECHIATSVALKDGKVYFGHYGNEFLCVDIEKAEVMWRHKNPRHPFFSSAAVSEKHVVFGGRDKRLHCLERKTGKPLWQFPTRRKIDGSPVICGDRVVFGSGDGTLHVVDLESGEGVWHYEMGRSIFSSPAVLEGMIVVGSNDGNVYAFRARP